eukprot:GDKK01028377.1.p2 GENE.GDKK01028377.1~~GDKK01028377.1.p2  ORF type:complete len:105 (-),score=2.37 GDKK01028377.1:499-813(-)
MNGSMNGGVNGMGGVPVNMNSNINLYPSMDLNSLPYSNTMPSMDYHRNYTIDPASTHDEHDISDMQGINMHHDSVAQFQELEHGESSTNLTDLDIDEKFFDQFP